MTPDPSIVLDLIEAFRRSKTMFAALHLGVFDKLAAGPAPAEALAGGVHLDTFTRLLDACVSLGLLAKDGVVYSNTPTADAYLRRSSPTTLAGYVGYSNDVLYQMWGNLEDAVREGTHRWKQTYGHEGNIFTAFYRTPESRREFLLGMHGLGLLSSPSVVAAFDLSRFRRMVDLGGGTGHLPAAAAHRYPDLSVAVFDLPAAVDSARDFTAGTPVELIPGDFFTDPLPSADLYALGRILHDWSDEKNRRLLAKIAAALPSGGGLLIAEKLLLPDLSGPTPAHMQSLNMLVCTEGRERSLAQYSTLLKEAGFSSVEGAVTDRPLDAILAVK